VKKLVREIVLSAAYQQSSSGNEQNAAIDPQNETLWKMDRRRLTVEQWRDALLFTSGELEPAGGKSLELDDPDNHKRTVYARISRLQLNSMLMQFDYPDANVHAESRSTTTTAMQKLFALNSPFVLDCAKSLSQRIAQTKDREAQIRNAFRTLYARDPDATELKMRLTYLKAGDQGERWSEYAQALLISNEMMYVD